MKTASFAETRSTFLAACTVALCGLPATFNLHAAELNVAPDGIKLTPDDPQQAHTQFGQSVAVSSGIAVAGVPNDDQGACCSFGAAYVFVREGSNWVRQAKLVASDRAAGDMFGSSVALGFQTIVVGASSDDTRSGSAYVFVQDGTNWTQQAKLTAMGRRFDDFFGSSVAIEGDTILVGVPEDEEVCPNRFCNTGSAYVFVRHGTNWVRQAKLTANNPIMGEDLGRAVALSGNTAAVGTLIGDNRAVYIFVRQGGTWAQQARLVPDDNGFGFGFSVAIQGDRLVVGARDDEPFNAGSAYVFERSGTNWTQKAKLRPSNPGNFRHFGFSVALSGDRVLIGSIDGGGPTPSGDIAGAAYLFGHNGTTWTEEAILTANPALPGDGFGHSVALRAGTALVGHPLDDGGCGQQANCDTGSAYVFPLESPPTVNLHRNDPTASEPGKITAQFKVTRSGNTNEALRVFYEVSGTATPGIDYTPLRGFATIAAGETVALFKVKPIDDNDAEPSETVNVTLAPDPAYDVVRPYRAMITITDDDSGP